MKSHFTVKEMIENIDFQIIHLASDYKKTKIYSSETNRPGLQLSGYFPRFEPSRLQIIGNAEWQYLKDLTGRERRGRFLEFVKRPIPAIIFTSDNYIFDEIIDLSKAYDRTLLRTESKTGKFISDYYSYASKVLSPKTLVHGVFIEVDSQGVLIMGDSGVGKSETGLDLVMRGHKLISDDVVEITKISDRLEGRSPEITKHFMEIRGVGIVNVRRLYGSSSIKESHNVDIIVKLEEWDSSTDYERLGLDEEYTKILGLDVASITVPMKPGRNTAMIIEVAIRNLAEKKLGYSSAKELNDRVLDKIKQRKNSSLIDNK